jgi:hypothetical protein
MNTVRKLIRIFTIIFIIGLYTLPIYANGTACGLLPCDQYQGQFKVGNISDQVKSLIQFGVSLIFVIIIIFGIYLIIKAALTIIRSEGDEGKIQEGAKIIKGVYIGIAIIFVGIIGLLLVLAFFRAEGIAGVDTKPPTDLNVPLLTK